VEGSILKTKSLVFTRLDRERRKLRYGFSVITPYVERIATPRIGVATVSGKWRWLHGAVDFDRLWIPKDFAPPSVLRDDAEAGVGQPKFTEPGHWTLTPEKQFGRIIFEIFPDSGPDLRMVQPL
jgi:hypothetical protein